MGILSRAPIYEVLKSSDIDLLKKIIEADEQNYCPENIEKFINTAGNIGFIVKLNEQVIGLAYCYSLLNLDGRLMMYVYSVDILKEYQNNGYGTGLMRFVVEYSKNHGYSECYVPVYKNNITARRIYEKAGMVCGDDALEYEIKHKSIS